MEVVYFEGDDPVDLPVSAVAAALRVIIEQGRISEFIEDCADKGHTVSAAPALINFTKDFINNGQVPGGDDSSSEFFTLAARVGRCDHTYDC